MRKAETAKCILSKVAKAAADNKPHKITNEAECSSEWKSTIVNNSAGELHVAFWEKQRFHLLLTCVKW